MKRFAKSTVLSLAKRRGSLSSASVSRYLLSLLGIGFDAGKAAPRYPGGSKAASVISLDFDHITKSLVPGSTRWHPKPVDDLLVKNRVGTREMLELSSKYELPMTWAICGKTAEEDPASYASILEAQTKQEIGVHTYSHADVISCSPEELEQEVAKCLDVLALSERPKTFIFPWNRAAHFDLLKKLGFETFRDQKRVVGAPREHLGLLNIPPTYYVDTKSYGAFPLIKQYLDYCISWNSVFHLWLHPWSVVFDPSDTSGRFVKETLDPLFSYMKKKKETGELAVCTMGELATFWKESKRPLQK